MNKTIKMLFMGWMMWLPSALMAQTVIVTDDPDYTTGMPSAVLDIKSESGGMLIPRMNMAARNSISEPATGLLIFQTDDDPGFYYNAGCQQSPLWIRLIAEESGTEMTHTNMVRDIDGNNYTTIHLGNNEWMTENLRVTHFRDGSPVPEPAADQWPGNEQAARAWYDNLEIHGRRFGALYNWHAATHPAGLCPPGWTIPDEQHWNDLTGYLGGLDEAGQALRTAIFWNTPVEATNTSQFSALPGGYRHEDNDQFAGLRTYGGWWSSAPADENGAVASVLKATNGLIIETVSQQRGLSIRCVKK